MCTISSSPLLHGSVDLNVRDVHGIDIQTLHLQKWKRVRGQEFGDIAAQK